MESIALLFVGALQAATGFGVVDLNRPGALERLRAERPSHYAAFADILRASERAPCRENELEVIKARHDLERFSCSFLMMTSYPAKRRIQFSLERTQYTYTVTMRDDDARLMPAHDTGR